MITPPDPSRQWPVRLPTEPYQEARPLMITTYESGENERWREMALLVLEARFGPLSPAVK